MELNLTPGIFLGGLIGGALGGFLTGMYFHWLEPGFGWKRVLIVSGGWAVSGIVCGLLSLISSGFGLICGLPFSIAAGSAVLFWLLWRSHQGL